MSKKLYLLHFISFISYYLYGGSKDQKLCIDQRYFLAIIQAIDQD